jgi:hypothetical protein
MLKNLLIAMPFFVAKQIKARGATCTLHRRWYTNDAATQICLGTRNGITRGPTLLVQRFAHVQLLPLFLALAKMPHVQFGRCRTRT